MLKVLIFSIIVVFVDSATYQFRHSYPNKIIGGEDVDIQNYPYQISLQYFGHHSCGGSIITETRILSAAHCTQTGTIDDYTVRANSTIREVGGIVYSVLNICNHPNYNPVTIQNDITVITVSGSLQYDVVLHSIALAENGHEVSDGSLGIVTGWGLISDGGERARILQKLVVPKVNDQLCNQTFNILPEMICFGYYQNDMNVCSSDSGGPLVVDNTQVGIVSYGAARCGAAIPAVYAKVSKLREHVNHCLNY